MFRAQGWPTYSGEILNEKLTQLAPTSKANLNLITVFPDEGNQTRRINKAETENDSKSL
jgi:hypothetical protein